MKWTPTEVKDLVSRNVAVAQFVDPEEMSLEDLQAYLEVNKDGWETLDDWFQGRKGTDDGE